MGTIIWQAMYQLLLNLPHESTVGSLVIVCFEISFGLFLVVDLFQFVVYTCIIDVYLLFILITLILVYFICTWSSDSELWNCSYTVEMVNFFTIICLLV
jgi:hypothetical protein